MHAGSCSHSDETYARLLETILKRDLEEVPPDVRANILAYYVGPETPKRTRKERRAWQRTVEELAALKAGPGSALAAEVRQRLLTPPPRLHSPKAKDTGQF